MSKAILLFVAVLFDAICAQPNRLDGPAERNELEKFLDPIFARQIADHRFTGAVFAFVRDGKVLFAKGYRSTDLTGATGINPETTPFRVASISKTITAVAALQLVEQGQLSLTEI